MKRILLFGYVYLFSFLIYSQKPNNTQLIFKPQYGHQLYNNLDSFFLNVQNNYVKFETLKFYISNVEFLNNNQVVFSEKNSYHLIDASLLKTTGFFINLKSEKLIFNQLKFNLGIDSLTNTLGVLGEDLDPTREMYWTWQSGYINFKLEGSSKICKSHKNKFQFHIGGYQHPFNSLKKITLNIVNPDVIIIFLDLKKLIENIDLINENQIMSPNSRALKLAELISKCFKIEEI